LLFVAIDLLLRAVLWVVRCAELVPTARWERQLGKVRARERFGRDKTVFKTAWLYGYDVGRELQ
jgi:hypothetical protein